METTTFTALCERAGRWWTIHVPQIEGMTAQVRSLDQAEINLVPCRVETWGGCAFINFDDHAPSYREMT